MIKTKHTGYLGVTQEAVPSGSFSFLVFILNYYHVTMHVSVTNVRYLSTKGVYTVCIVYLRDYYLKIAFPLRGKDKCMMDSES